MHIIIWKYLAGVGVAERGEHVARLAALPGVIPEIVTFAVGRDVLGLARSYDTGLVATFRDRAGLEAYTVHPEHAAVAEFGRSISEHVASVDFEDAGEGAGGPDET